MVEVSVIGDRVRFDVQGSDWLLAVKRRIELPASAIAGVARNADFPRYWGGVRIGTGLPGVLRAGSYYWSGKWTFWDVRFTHADRVIRVDLQGVHYDRLVIEVRDPDAAIRTIESARAGAAA